MNKRQIIKCEFYTIIILLFVVFNCLQGQSNIISSDKSAGFFKVKRGDEFFNVSIFKRPSTKKFRVDTILFTLYNDTMSRKMDGSFVDDHHNLNASYDYLYYKVTVQDSLVYLHKYLRPFGDNSDDFIDGYRTINLKTGKISEYQMIFDGKIVPVSNIIRRDLDKSKIKYFHHSTQHGIIVLLLNKSNFALRYYNNNGALLWKKDNVSMYTMENIDFLCFKIKEQSNKILIAFQLYSANTERNNNSNFLLYHHILIDKNTGAEISKFDSNEAGFKQEVSGVDPYFIGDNLSLVYTNNEGIHMVNNIETTISEKVYPWNNLTGIDPSRKNINYVPSKVINTKDGYTYIFTQEYYRNNSSFKNYFFENQDYARKGFVIFVFGPSGNFLKTINYFGEWYFSEPILLKDQMTIAINKVSVYGNGSLLSANKDIWIDYLEIRGSRTITNNKKFIISKNNQYLGYISNLRKAVFLSHSRKSKIVNFSFEQLK